MKTFDPAKEPDPWHIQDQIQPAQLTQKPPGRMKCLFLMHPLALSLPPLSLSHLALYMIYANTILQSHMHTVYPTTAGKHMQAH